MLEKEKILMLVNPKRGLAHKKTSFDFHQGSFFCCFVFLARGLA